MAKIYIKANVQNNNPATPVSAGTMAIFDNGIDAIDTKTQNLPSDGSFDPANYALKSYVDNAIEGIEIQPATTTTLGGVKPDGITILVDTNGVISSIGGGGGGASIAGAVAITDSGNYYTSNNVEGALQEVGSDLVKFNNNLNLTKEPTGFTNNSAIDVSYDSTTRKITLTGTFEAYYKGNKITELVSGWESDAHANVNGNYFLYYDGSFHFTTTAWTYDSLHIAYIQFDTHKIGVREPHGFMNWQSHLEFHNTVGTYLSSGGDLSAYVLNSTTVANRRPNISSTVLYDEDLQSSLAALTSKLYTHRYLSGAAIRSFNVDQADIIANNGSVPYWNQNNAGNWQQTLFTNNEYGAIFIVAIPTTSDTNSQKYRYMFVQPQQVSTTLAAIQALTPTSLTHGDSSALVSEFCFVGKIIIQATGSNWSIVSVEKLTGTRLTQVASPSGNYLSTVTHNSSLSGEGTPSNPLSVVNDGHTHDTRYYTEAEIDAALALKQATITGGASSIVSSNLTINRALISDASGKVAISSVTSAELVHLSGVSSNIQTQINAKQAIITGAASTVVTSNLTPARIVYVDDNGKLAATGAVNTTHLSYLIGVTSNIQTQLDAKAPRKIELPTAKTASFTLDLTLDGQLVRCDSASAITVTVPTNATVAFPLGTMIMVLRYNTGACTFAAAGGVTIRSVGSKLSVANQYEVATLVKIGTDEWSLFGALS